MSPATLLLVIQLIQVAEAGAPIALQLILDIKKALARDPNVPNVIDALAADSQDQAGKALATIAAWRAAHKQ